MIMSRPVFLILIALLAARVAPAQSLPSKTAVIETMKRVNDYWINGHSSDSGDNNWARSVYFEGDMTMHAVWPEPRYYNYALAWAERHAWGLRGGVATRDADDQTCGHAYLDLYQAAPDAKKIADISSSIGAMVAGSKSDDWWWIDALQMAMPLFARLGVLRQDPHYFSRMHDFYTDTKLRRGLYNPADRLWYRDGKFAPPYTEPNGARCYWARGNGWVFAAHARVLEALPPSDPFFAEYLKTFRDMAAALKAIQRPDGFWNVSLFDPNHYGGPETSGTSFFLYGLAWGINRGWLDRAVYEPAVTRAWNGLATLAVHPDGLLGYVQGVGSQPSSSQPVTADGTADFGVGAFLMAASEVYKLAGGPAPRLRPNLAVGCPVRWSAQQTGNEATHLADNNSQTRWAAQNFPQWVEIDLGSSRLIDCVELVPYLNRAYQYLVESRNSGAEGWRMLVDRRANKSACSLYSHAFAPVPARYVRLSVTGLSGNSSSYVNVNEFLVFEAGSASRADGAWLKSRE